MRRRGLSTGRRCLLACLLLSFWIQLPLSPCWAVGVPVTAIILNVPPKVADVSLADRWGPVLAGVDPGVQAWVDVVIVDNNTVSDVLLVRVVLYLDQPGSADSPNDHYTFTWTAATGFEGDALVPSACRAPSSMNAVEGTWRFTFELAKSALSSPAWTCEVTASDEEKSATWRKMFSVNEFASVRVSTASVSLAGQPGTLVPAVQNPFYVYYLCNHAFEVGVRATPFVGTESSEFVIEPGRFTVSASPDPEEGLTLSESRKVLAMSAAGEGGLGFHIFASVPDPFLDQDYQGEIIFDLRPRREG